MTSTKPILPVLKDRKRYLKYEVVNGSSLSQEDIEKEIIHQKNKFFGEYLSGKAGIQLMKKQFDKKTNTGLIRVGHKYVDHLKVTLGLITKIKNQDALIRTVTLSGTMKKALAKK